jgi:hypothetical protein
MHNKINKTKQFDRLQYWYYRLKVFMKEAIEMHTKFNEDWFKHSSNVKVIPSIIWGTAVLVSTDGKDL